MLLQVQVGNCQRNHQMVRYLSGWDYKEKQKFRGHDRNVGILFSLFFSPISMAQQVVHLVALTVLEVFPRGLNSLVVFLAVYMDLRKAPT